MRCCEKLLALCMLFYILVCLLLLFHFGKINNIHNIIMFKGIDTNMEKINKKKYEHKSRQI